MIFEQAKFAQDVAKLIQYIASQGFLVTLDEAYRSPDLAKIYARKGIGITDSLHCKRLAIDLMLHDKDGNYLKDPTAYFPFADYWESLDPKNKNGRNFKIGDSNHFQRSL